MSRRPRTRVQYREPAEIIPLRVEEPDETAEATSELPASGARQYPGKQRAMLYLPQPVYQAVRSIAFHHHIKMHDVLMQGVDLALTKYGSPSIAELTKTKTKS